MRHVGRAAAVNNAGGALGWAPVAEADEQQWRAMYETNVLGVVRMTEALLPTLEADGDGHVVTVGSIAGHEPYPGGAGYNAAKFAVRAVDAGAPPGAAADRPVARREVDPGMVETEFSLVRFGGDADRAAAVYEGVTPLTADDVGRRASRWVASRPSHVNVDQGSCWPATAPAPARSLPRAEPAPAVSDGVGDRRPLHGASRSRAGVDSGRAAPSAAACAAWPAP